MGKLRTAGIVLALLALLSGFPAVAAPGAAGDVPAPAGGKRAIRTIIVDNYRPYTFVNDKGEPDGFSVAILRAVARAVGLEVEIRADTWERAKKGLADGTIDVLPMMAYSTERDTLFDFSAPHTIAFDSVFVKNGNRRLRSLEELSGKTVIVMNKDAAHEYLVAHGYDTRQRLVLVDSLPEALRRLAAGDADAALMPKLVGLVLAGELGLAEVVGTSAVIGEYNRPFSFAVLEGNRELLERLNYGLSIVQVTGQYAAIYKKWFAALEDPQLPWETALRYALLMAAVLAALLAWGLVLRGQVRSRTRPLEAEIAQRRLAEASVRASESKYRTIFDSAGDAIYIHDPDGKMLDVNLVACDRLGYTRAELMGLTPEDLASPEHAALVPERTRLLLERGQLDFETSQVRKDGSGIPSEISSRVIEHEGRQAILSAARDITERRLADERARAARVETERLLAQTDQARRELLIVVEDQRAARLALQLSEGRYRQLAGDLEERVRDRTQQLEAMNKELESFAYSISHDLRAPLRAAEGFAAIVAEDYGERLDAEGRRLLGVVRANVKRMGQLIDGLLVLSRAGRSELRPGRVAMTELARSAFLEVAADDAARARIDFTVGELPVVEGDATLLRQVWLNLLANAVKFSANRERPVIEVSGALAGDRVVYRVRDNGVGFDMQYAGKLFGVFQRLHSPEQFEGTGIGLALVQRIVTRHGGSVQAEGAVGRGATFSFSLPARRLQAGDP